MSLHTPYVEELKWLKYGRNSLNDFCLCLPFTKPHVPSLGSVHYFCHLQLHSLAAAPYSVCLPKRHMGSDLLWLLTSAAARVVIPCLSFLSLPMRWLGVYSLIPARSAFFLWIPMSFIRGSPGTFLSLTHFSPYI